MRCSPEEPQSESRSTFSDADTDDDDFMIEWLRLAARRTADSARISVRREGRSRSDLWTPKMQALTKHPRSEGCVTTFVGNRRMNAVNTCFRSLMAALWGTRSMATQRVYQW